MNDGQRTNQYLRRSTLVMLMQGVRYLLTLARRCRDFEKTAIEPEVIEQLRVWAIELAGMAEDFEPRAVQPEMAEGSASD